MRDRWYADEGVGPEGMTTLPDYPTPTPEADPTPVAAPVRLAPPDSAPYQNFDEEAMARWIDEVAARGNVFDFSRGLELDGTTGKPIGKVPNFFRTV
jgi:hypothetical protein